MLDCPLDVQDSLKALDRQGAEGAIKIWEDLERYDAAIKATGPEVIVECGTWYGGSALWFASRGINVVTVDIETDKIVAPANAHPKITIVTGDSADPNIAALIADRLKGRRVMVVLDSDHSPKHVEREINLYGPLVTPGCHLVVEDGILRWMSNMAGAGPLDAIESRLADSDDWERDLTIESMHPVTMHPAGWWIRA